MKRTFAKALTLLTALAAVLAPVASAQADETGGASDTAKVALATRPINKSWGQPSGWHPNGSVGGGNSIGSLGDSFVDEIALHGDLPEGGYVEVFAYEPQAGDKFDPAKAKPMSGFPQRIDLTAQQIADAKAGKWVTFASKETGPVTTSGRFRWAVTLYDAKGGKVADDNLSCRWRRSAAGRLRPARTQRDRLRADPDHQDEQGLRGRRREVP